jgi:hypothetical protein
MMNDWQKVGPIHFLAAVTGGLCLVAADRVGYLFGMIVGSSLSPIGATVAPLVFGLLAIIGFGGAIAATPDAWTISRVTVFALTAAAVIMFCNECHRGINDGIERRDGNYPPMNALLTTSDPVARGQLYELRWRMKRAGIGRQDFTPFIAEAVEPLLNNSCLSPEEKRAKIADLTDALPK